MNLAQLSTRAFAVSALLGLATSPAWAGDCRTNNRPLPSPAAQDSMAMSCDSLAGAATTGVASISNSGGTFSVTANLSAGVQVLSQLLNTSGNVICTAQDSTTTGGGNTQSCAGAVNPGSWRGFLNHAL